MYIYLYKELFLISKINLALKAIRTCLIGICFINKQIFCLPTYILNISTKHKIKKIGFEYLIRVDNDIYIN